MNLETLSPSDIIIQLGLIAAAFLFFGMFVGLWLDDRINRRSKKGG